MLRESLVNQTDITHKLRTDQFENTLLVGTEFAWQDSQNFRFDGRFNTPAGPTTIAVPFAQSNFSNPVFFNVPTNNNKTDLQVSSAYVQDQLDFGLVQLIGGLRFERFDLDYTNVINGTRFSRIDEEVSPRAGVILKPFEQISFYASYSKVYLPYSGDQFQSLDATTKDLEPEEFVNREIGAKWDIAPRLMFTAALFKLDRENTRAVDPANPTRTVQTGSTRTEGGEVELNGYITDDWQVPPATPGSSRRSPRRLPDRPRGGCRTAFPGRPVQPLEQVSAHPDVRPRRRRPPSVRGLRLD